MRKKILFVTFFSLFFYKTISDYVRTFKHEKYVHEHNYTKSELKQMYNILIMYMDEDKVSPEHENIYKIFKDNSFSPWIQEAYPNEVKILYKPGLKLSEVNVNDKVFSFRKAYILWDGTTGGDPMSLQEYEAYLAEPK